MCSTSLLFKILQQLWWRVSQSLMLFIHRIWGQQYFEAVFFLVSLHTSERMRFLTILQDKLCSFNNQGDRSRPFLCKANYRIDHIFKLFHEENFILSGLFSRNNLLLSGKQGKKWVFRENVEKFPKSPIQPLTSAQFAVRAIVCLNNIIKNL